MLIRSEINELPHNINSAVIDNHSTRATCKFIIRPLRLQTLKDPFLLFNTPRASPQELFIVSCTQKKCNQMYISEIINNSGC